MSARTNPHKARVEHLLRNAAITYRHGLDGAADRFIRLATELLDTHRVPGANTYRDRITQLQEDKT